MNKLDESILVQEICKHLDLSIAQLPESAAQQLHASREAAIAQLAQPSLADEDSLAKLLSRELNENNQVSEEIDARLNLIRQNAVARFEKQQAAANDGGAFSALAWLRSQRDAFSFPAAAGMLATACVLLTVVSLFFVNSRPAGTLTLEEEIGLVATAEDIELYENLEFYLWLAENESLTL